MKNLVYIAYENEDASPRHPTTSCHHTLGSSERRWRQRGKQKRLWQEVDLTTVDLAESGEKVNVYFLPPSSTTAATDILAVAISSGCLCSSP